MKQVQTTIGSLCVAWLALGIEFWNIPVFAAESATAGQKEKPVAEETFDAFGADAGETEPPRKFPNAELQQRIDNTAVRTYDGGEESSITNLIQEMIAKGIALTAKSSWGNSILEMAIVRGDLASVKLLLDHGVKIVETCPTGYTSLRAAAHRGRKDMVDYLMEKGAKLDIFSAAALGLADEAAKILEKDPALANARLCKGGSTPLMWTMYAAGKGNMDRFTPFWMGRLAVAEMLIKKGADVNATTREGEILLFDAIGERGKYRFAELLLTNGANVNVKTTCPAGWTPLFTAVWFKDAQKVRLLLDHGADVNIIGENYERPTPLHLAIDSQNTNIVGMLVAKGADLSLKNRAGQTPLDAVRAVGLGRILAEMYAAQGIKLDKELPGASEICKAMKSSDPKKWDEVKAMVEENPKAINEKPSETVSYNTPFRDAIQFRAAPISIIELMIAKGVDINSGLSYAVYSGRKDVFDLLLEHGAVVNADNGDSLLVAACQSGSKDAKDLVELLLEKGVSANGKDGDKYPPLATAIFYGLNSDIARVLIDHDASVNRKVGAFMPDEKDGQSLLELARHQAAKHNNSGTQGIVDLLIQAGAKDRPDTGDKN